jgi:MoxR-like ATPase
MRRNDPKNPVDAFGNPKVECKECGCWYHRLDVHLATKHQMKVEEYQEKYPGAETISEKARESASKAQMKGIKGMRSSGYGARPTVAPPKPVPAPSGNDDDRPMEVGVATLNQRKSLEPFDQAFVPKHDEAWQIGEREMDFWEALAVALEATESPYIAGPTGCGKTAGVKELACVLNQPVRRVNCNGDMLADDFLGMQKVEVDPETGTNYTTWQDGVLPQAMRRGHWLLLDELDAAPEHVTMVLQSVLEMDHTLVLLANGGEVVKAHPSFRIIATANTLGRGDESGLHGGRTVLDEAFLDRFGVTIRADYPDVETEVRILVSKSGIDEGTARRMVQCATAVREALERGECHCTLSTRRLISWAQKAVKFGHAEGVSEKNKQRAMKRASELTVTNKLGNGDRDFVTGVIQRYFFGEV